MLSDYIKEFKEKEAAERALREAKSSRIAAWVSAAATIVATIIAIIVFLNRFFH